MARIFGLAGGLILALLALPSQAQSWGYNFGTWHCCGTVFQPDESFASLSVSTQDNRSFDFTLRAFDAGAPGNLISDFGPNAFIAKAVFNTVSNANPISISNIQTNGYVSGVSLGTGDLNVGGVTFDFWDGLGVGTALQSGEWISWTVNFASSQQPLLGIPPVAILVSGFVQQNSNGSTWVNASAWYTPVSAVPEAETYAMLLAGLGLMGFVARRRQRNLAAS